MRKTLLASTCLVAVIATPAYAETVIGNALTTPIRTSTVNGGTAPDDARLAASGSIKPTSGTAVTIDSNHKMTNEGTIQITNADGSIGILANAGTTGAITNAASGKIVIDETYAPTAKGPSMSPSLSMSVGA